MSVTILTSREFNQEPGRAKKAAANGPVFITDRGRPAHVLLSIEAYRCLVGSDSIADLLAMPGADAVDLELPRVGEVARPADLD